MESTAPARSAYQMFYAEEVDSTTLEVRDVLKLLSGKSGGEKESFAAWWWQPWPCSDIRML